MKKLYILAAALASALVLGLPALAGAEEPINTGTAATTTIVPIPASNQKPGIILPIPAASIKAKLESGYDARMQNLRNNEDYRNTVMSSVSGPGTSTTAKLESENGMMPLLPREIEASKAAMMLASTSAWRTREGTTTEPRFDLMPLLMRRFASSTPFASSTMTEMMNAYRGRVENMRADLFAWTQNHLVDELSRALDNLKQIEGRVASRIQTETQNGRDMSSSTELLSITDLKISTADLAIKALAAYMPPASSTADASASTTIDLGQPRVIGSDAIRAVNDAKKALNDVVTAIAHALGVKLGENEHQNATTTTQ